MNGRRRVRGWGASGCSNLTASGTRGGVARDVTKTPNLTFNTSGSPADATSCAAAQLVASAGEPEVLKVRLGVRFPLATTHPV